MKNVFNPVVFIYDKLARVTFGPTWNEVQLSPVKHLNGKGKVLIVGGGTGAILEKIRGCGEVTFLEFSPKMIEVARGRTFDGEVEFILQDYLKWTTHDQFDAILLPFFLDSFNERNLLRILNKVKKELKDTGELIVIDFQKGSLLQNLQVWIMYRFFRIVVNLEAGKLLNLQDYINKKGFKKVSEERYLKKWVFCSQYIKL